MSLLFVSKPYTSENKREAISDLLNNTHPDRDFYLLVLGAIILATSGILIDSIPVLIASMIVAPLAFPILSMSLGLVVGDRRLFLRSTLILLISVGLAIVVGGAFSLFAQSYFSVAERVFISFFPNIFFDILIAVISGFIAAYGLVRSRVNGAMTGIGIAVSLMPPLVAIGMGLFNPVNDLAMRAGSIFIFNVVGIIIGSMTCFLIFNIGKEYIIIKNNF